jgi:hypothetical protein
MMGLKSMMNLIWNSFHGKKKCNELLLKWSNLFFCFWNHLIHLMFTTCWPSCWIFVSNFYESWRLMWGICLVFKYDKYVMIPLLMICFDWFCFVFEACVVNVDLFNFQYEKDENNMFNTRTSMEKFFNVLVVGKF